MCHLNLYHIEAFTTQNAIYNYHEYTINKVHSFYLEIHMGKKKSVCVILHTYLYDLFSSNIL